MGKTKLRPIAAIMKIIESVPGDAREELEADLRDLLRPAPKPRQKGKGSAHTRQVLCVIDNCFLPASSLIHHPMTNGYHPFRGPASATERKPSQKRKAQTAIVPEVTTTIPDNAHCGKSDCYRPFDDNIHHKKLAEGYHEFVEPAGEAKGAGG